MQRAFVDQRMVSCVNLARGELRRDLLVSVPDAAANLCPSLTPERVAHVLRSSGVAMYRANQ